jgi:hypothetical protein
VCFFVGISAKLTLITDPGILGFGEIFVDHYQQTKETIDQ